MFTLRRVSGPAAILSALGDSLAIIEFDRDGQILSANANFCRTLGYELNEIKGRHHRMFVEAAEANAPAYEAFWVKLRQGKGDAREYKRIAKGGREVWIQASYNPVRDRRGRVVKIVKQATDVTVEKLKAAEVAAKLEALSRVQAIIEFAPDGRILAANQNFLDALGYRLDEIDGQHHRMFVDPAYARSDEYTAFWRRLNAGEFVAQEFCRLGKGGREVWIQASYNPIFDLNGRVVKVVKFATDVTDRVRAVQAVAAGLGKMADNDLVHRIEGNFGLAFQGLVQDFNASASKTQAALVEVARSTQAIDGTTTEIASATQDLARRSEQQAASLEETAAALDEITATVRKSADGAAQAQEAVANANGDAEASVKIVEQAVAAMAAIEQSSQQIGQIIGIIDEIAFQTNLLALNAGVEAARAGDAGRGFAVVASEVRGLAQRSAEAAKDIKKLILTSSQQVKDGGGLVTKTGQSLARIMAQVAEINGAIGEIAASAREQATALQEVNVAVNQMDQVTQHNAAMVEETTAASQALAKETSRLSTIVGRFEVGEKIAMGPGEERSVVRHTAKHRSPDTHGPARTLPARHGSAALRVVDTAPVTEWEEF